MCALEELILGSDKLLWKYLNNTTVDVEDLGKIRHISALLRNYYAP
jgi:hypothetical protein